MSSNFILGGVVFTPLVPQLVVAIALTVLMSFIFVRINFYRFVSSRPIVEVCMFCIVLGLLVTLT